MGAKTKDTLQQVADVATILGSFGLNGKEIVGWLIAAFGMLGAFGLGIRFALPPTQPAPAPAVIERVLPSNPVAIPASPDKPSASASVPATVQEVKPDRPVASQPVESRDANREAAISKFCANRVSRETRGDPIKAQALVMNQMIADCQREMAVYHAENIKQ